MGVITFNNLSSSTYGILVEHPPGYHIPERDYEYIHVPGRNGDLIIDKGSYQNGRRSYDIAFADLDLDYAVMANKVAEWLHSPSGYARLSDTYEPGYYRMASYVDEVDIENILFHAGRATIEFNCKPQRYLTSGEATDSVSGSSNITWTKTNPTRQTALPYIKATGNGTITVTVNNVLVATISNVSGYVEIDSDIQDVFKGSISMNNNTQLATGNFPKLGTGSNSIKISGSVSKLEVKPRWWTL